MGMTRRTADRSKEVDAGTLFREHAPFLLRLVERLTGPGDHVEDVVQEVFLTAHRRRVELDADADLRGWLYRVAVNHCKNRIRFLRRRGGGRTRPVDDLTDADWAAATAVAGGPAATGISAPDRPDELLVARRLAERLQARLDRLDPDLRALVVLRDIEGLSYAEIAEVTGQPLGTVKSRIHRGRMALRDREE